MLFFLKGTCTEMPNARRIGYCVQVRIHFRGKHNGQYQSICMLTMYIITMSPNTRVFQLLNLCFALKYSGQQQKKERKEH